MPLFYQHNINESTRMAIWRIEEPEAFFLSRVPSHGSVTHPYKKLQHLAGRYALTAIFEDFPLEEIVIADTQKPFLPNDRYHFSISHSGNLAAVIASNRNRVGIDIELITGRIKVISEKFLGNKEKKYLNDLESVPQVQLELMTVYWSAKEAIFKWYGDGEIDFRKHLEITAVRHNGSNGTLDCVFRKNGGSTLTVHYHLVSGFVVAWVVT
ncbi:MAG TPA: 4'-phosphopantetheinyl transferase superfamily protein [Puia sp.]|nr:4'-phosphopantetheinyl transferase superfamily protein [Puia sp.]